MAEDLYTDERNAQIAVALLKAHGIRRIIVNPGTGNMAFVERAERSVVHGFFGS